MCSSDLSSEVMNVKVFSALSRNVGKLREMKKAHEDMSMDITVLKLEYSNIRRHVFMSLLHLTKFADIPAKSRKNFDIHHFAGLLHMSQSLCVSP